VRRVIVIVAWVAFLVAGLGAQVFPRPVGKVNDFAGLLTAEQQQALGTMLEELERDTTAEVAVVTVRALGGLTVEEYANRLFAEWGIGKKGMDNGVLILVSLEDRAMRIEVGYGLEGILPDGLAGAVIRETFTPRFQNSQYAEGLAEGTARVADIVRRNETLSAEQLAALEAGPEASTGPIVFMLAIFVGMGAFALGTGIGSKVASSTLTGLVVTGLSLFFGVLGAPPAGLVFLALLAVAVIATGIVLGRRPSWRKSLRGTGKRAGGSGWVMGGGGGSGSSGSGGGSSSFGGGRSGGGGASGRW